MLAAAVATSLLVRVVYVLRMQVPAYDPWRHLALLTNLRSGEGFTLFAGQPYLWYNPGWHQLLAALPAGTPPTALPAVLSSLLCVPVFYLVRWLRPEASLWPAAAAAFGVALCGPLVRHTCHFGPEAFALALALFSAMLAARGRSPSVLLLAGLLFGVALSARLNVAFLAFLCLPFLRSLRRASALAVGAALPLALAWWRNHAIISSYPYVFTWDGLATRSSDFNAWTTLFLQGHPAISQGLRRLHEQIVPDPNWIRDAGGFHLDTVLFMAAGTCALVLSRSAALLLAGLAPIAYFLLFDETLSSHFFRIYVASFPVFFLGAGLALARWDPRPPWRAAAAAALVVVLFTWTGYRLYTPPPYSPLAVVTPPAGLLSEDRYMVNSAFYHPESLVFRFPDKHFIGLPLDPAQLPDFLRQFPEYRAVLWHSISVQQPVLEALLGAGYRVTGEARSQGGLHYRVLEAPAQAAAEPARRGAEP